MSFLADYHKDYPTWNYIEGRPNSSLATSRYFHLSNLNLLSDWTMKFAFRDTLRDRWSKWLPLNKVPHNSLRYGLDIHRSLLYNEIVVESDYPDYLDNVNATRMVGRILEHKGFSPMYYYSGNKSIHCHIILDFDMFLTLDKMVLQELVTKTKKLYLFKRKFMEWIREKIINCWDLNIRQFDKDLVKCSHLIRSELSRNKLGFKTFLGYTYKDITCVQQICNEENGIQPCLGELKISKPHNFQEIVEEFLMDLNQIALKTKTARKEKSLMDWTPKPTEIRPQVKFMLSEEFKSAGDGCNRAMFIICNELKRQELDHNSCLNIVTNWRDKMECDIKDFDIEYRLRSKNYVLQDSFLNKFLLELGFEKDQWRG